MALLAGCLLAAQVLAEERFTKQDADRFQTKLTRIVELGVAAPVRAKQPRSTPLTDVEVNSYLRYLATDQIPVGIVEPDDAGLGRQSPHRPDAPH